MKAYGQKRLTRCCPGHDPDLKSGYKSKAPNAGRKRALRENKRRARAEAKKIIRVNAEKENE